MRFTRWSPYELLDSISMVQKVVQFVGDPATPALIAGMVSGMKHRLVQEQYRPKFSDKECNG